jgi:hypothetical protein
MTEFKLITVTDSARRAMITVMILSVLTDLSPGPARPSGPGSHRDSSNLNSVLVT